LRRRERTRHAGRDSRHGHCHRLRPGGAAAGGRRRRPVGTPESRHPGHTLSRGAPDPARVLHDAHSAAVAHSAAGPASREGVAGSQRHGDPDVHPEADGLTRPSPRTLSSLAIVALAVILLAVGLPHPRSAAPFAPSPTDSVAPPVWSVRTDTLHAGETLSGLLERGGVRSSEMADILSAAPSLDARRIPAGMPIRVRQQAGDSLPSEIVFQLAVDRLLHVRRTSDSAWESTVEVLPWRTDTIVVRGVIRTNLYQALDDSASAILPGDVRS